MDRKSPLHPETDRFYLLRVHTDGVGCVSVSE